LGVRHEESVRQAIDNRQAGVGLDAVLDNDALAQAIFGDQRNAVRDGVARVGDLNGGAVDQNFSRTLGVDAE
jgi:hypothetical protein